MNVSTPNTKPAQLFFNEQLRAAQKSSNTPVSDQKSKSGGRVVVFKDGGKLQLLKSGHVVQTFVNGKKIQHHPDGKILTVMIVIINNVNVSQPTHSTL